MKKSLTIAAGLLAASLAPAPLAADDHEMSRGEAKLADMLEGRVAGEPTNCIRTIGSRNIQQIDETALVYRDGNTIWVNYTRTPDSIEDNDVMVIRRFTTSQLCRSDQITTIDRFAGFLTGFIMLDEFVPYTKVDEG